MADKDKITALRVIMPASGDMELIGQKSGTIDLRPVYYGNECMGPHLQVVEGHMENNEFVIDRVIERNKLKIKGDHIEVKRSNS